MGVINEYTILTFQLQAQQQNAVKNDTSAKKMQHLSQTYHNEGGLIVFNFLE